VFNIESDKIENKPFPDTIQLIRSSSIYLYLEVPTLGIDLIFPGRFDLVPEKGDRINLLSFIFFNFDLFVDFGLRIKEKL